MQFELNCSEKNKQILTKLSEYIGHSIIEDSSFVLSQKGYSVDEKKINIAFSDNNLHLLIEFLENFQQNKDYIIGQNDNNSVMIHFDDILYFHSISNSVSCVTKNGSFRVKQKLYELEEQYLDHRFTRINRSEIINIYSIDSIIPWFNSRLLIHLKHKDLELEVSKTYVKTFKNALRM